MASPLLRQTAKLEFPTPLRPRVGAERPCLAGGCEGRQIYGERPVPGWRCARCETFEEE